VASTGKVQAPHGGAKCCDTGLEIGVCLSCEGLIAEPLDSAYRFSDSAGFLRARFGAGNRSDSEVFFLGIPASETLALGLIWVISFGNRSACFSRSRLLPLRQVRLSLLAPIVLSHTSLQMVMRYANLVTADIQAVHERVSLLSSR
jgi:hypothetical protein